MAQSEATRHSDDFLPPRIAPAGNAPIAPARDGVISGALVLAVDGTSRAYDLTLLPINGKPFSSGDKDAFMVTMQAGTSDIFFAFSNATGTIDDTTNNAAGANPLVFASTFCHRLMANTEIGGYHLRRHIDKFLIVKCAAGQSSVLRFYTSSYPSLSAGQM